MASGLALELKRFLILKAHYDTSVIVPSFAVDQAWRHLLLFPREYAEICAAMSTTEKSVHCIIGYSPIRARDYDETESAFSTIKAYTHFFQTRVSDYMPELYWDQTKESMRSRRLINQKRKEQDDNYRRVRQLLADDEKFPIYINTQSTTISIIVHESYTIDHVKTLIKEQGFSVDRNDYRLSADGDALKDEKTIAEYELEREDSIYLYLQQKGC